MISVGSFRISSTRDRVGMKNEKRNLSHLIMDKQTIKHRPETSTSKSSKKRELRDKLSNLLKKDASEDEIMDVLFKLVYITMELGHWRDSEMYAKEMMKHLRITKNMDSIVKKNIEALQGSCEFYIGLNLAHQKDLIGAIKHYKQALKLFGEPKRHRTSFARIHRRLGEAILQLCGWANIGRDKRRVFLLTAWRHFAIGAEAFVLDSHLEEWQLCVKAIMTVSKYIVELDGNDIFLMEDTLQFLKRQLQRTDMSAKSNARGALNHLMQEACGKRVNNDAIIKDTTEKNAEMMKLREEIAPLDPEDLNRKSMECKLATLHIQVGENLNAIFVLLDTVKGETWSTNPNLLSFCFALIGVCWLNLGDPETALPYLRDAEYSFDTEHSSDDYRKIRDKRILAEKRFEDLKIVESQNSSVKEFRACPANYDKKISDSPMTDVNRNELMT